MVAARIEKRHIGHHPRSDMSIGDLILVRSPHKPYLRKVERALERTPMPSDDKLDAQPRSSAQEPHPGSG